MAETPKEIKVKVSTEVSPEVNPRSLSLGQKILGIMADIGAVEKGGWNVNQKYRFVQEVDVVNAVRPLLIKYGVIVHQTVYVGPDGLPMVSKSADGKVTTIVYEMQLIDAETGETWPKSILVQDGWDQADKGPNKTLTGANKWFHMRTWQIGAGTGEESEGDEKTDKATAAEAAKAGPRVVRGSQAGVQRGGKSNVVTAAQVKEIVRLVKDLDLDADAFAAVVKRVTGVQPGDEATGRELLAGLTNEQASNLIATLSTGAVDEAVETVDEGAEEAVEDVTDGENQPLAIV